MTLVKTWRGRRGVDAVEVPPNEDITEIARAADSVGARIVDIEPIRGLEEGLVWRVRLAWPGTRAQITVDALDAADTIERLPNLAEKEAT